MAISGEQLKSISQRLRYEAFSTFATEIGKVNNFEELNKPLAFNLKYIVAYQFARILFYDAGVTHSYTIENAESIFEESGFTPFELGIIESKLSSTFNTSELSDKYSGDSPIRDIPDGKVLFLPYSPNENRFVLLQLVSQTTYNENDIRFIKLIAEFLSNKLSQIHLSNELSDKNNMLYAQNEELNTLNHQINSLNQNLEQKIKERTEALKRSNDELMTVFYRSSHDLKAPLTTLRGLINLLEKPQKDDAFFESYIKKSYETIDQMASMFDKLSSLTATYANHEFSKTVFIRDIISIVLANHEQELMDLDIEVGVKSYINSAVKVDTFILTKVIGELVENTIHYCEADKTKSILHFEISETETEILVDVIDNGPGIPAMVLPHIFDMYYRGHEKSKGHGLGLYLVSKFLETINGRIVCCSSPKQGTWFRIYFPKK